MDKFKFWRKIKSDVTENDHINFKYHPNVWEQDVFIRVDEDNTPKCQCCGKPTKYYTENMYTKEDISCICPLCISSGKAEKKFKGQFVQNGEDDKVNDKAKWEELYYRTPGYISWQGEYWLACCDDYCAYIGDVGTQELEEMGIADEVFEEYDARMEYEDAREYLEKSGSMAGYLFKCLHCGKYHLWVDTD